jgi:hypothetical protein
MAAVTGDFRIVAAPRHDTSRRSILSVWYITQARDVCALSHRFVLHYDSFFPAIFLLLI